MKVGNVCTPYKLNFTLKIAIYHMMVKSMASRTRVSDLKYQLCQVLVACFLGKLFNFSVLQFSQI